MNKNAQDIMMGAPSYVEDKQLDELKISVPKKEEKEDWFKIWKNICKFMKA